MKECLYDSITYHFLCAKYPIEPWQKNHVDRSQKQMSLQQRSLKLSWWRRWELMMGQRPCTSQQIIPDCVLTSGIPNLYKVIIPNPQRIFSDNKLRKYHILRWIVANHRIHKIPIRVIISSFEETINNHSGIGDKFPTMAKLNPWKFLKSTPPKSFLIESCMAVFIPKRNIYSFIFDEKINYRCMVVEFSGNNQFW